MIYVYGMFFLLAIAKWADLVPVLTNISWWWILGPIALVVLWFELFERVFGFDQVRRLKDAQFETAKKERIAKQLKRKPSGRR